MFSGDNYRIYKGEALGLRAFLHLDLLRMFAPSYASNAQAPAIPYVMTYSTAVTPQSTVDKVLDYVIADAREALGKPIRCFWPIVWKLILIGTIVPIGLIIMPLQQL